MRTKGAKNKVKSVKKVVDLKAEKPSKKIKEVFVDIEDDDDEQDQTVYGGFDLDDVSDRYW